MASESMKPVAPLIAGLSIGETASRVGVSASTLRSWDRRYGLGPTGRSSGGHRRYTLGDLARLQQVRRLAAGGMSTGDAVVAASAKSRPTLGPDKRPQSLRLQQFSDDRLVIRLVEAADGLDSPGIARATRILLEDRGAIRTWTNVLMPLLQQIGGYWNLQQHGVECEHVISDALQAVLLTYSWNRAQQTAGEPPHAVLAATPTEGHTLPMYAVAAALAERGIGSRVLGTVPPTSLFMALEQLAPTAVVLWARTRDTADTELLRSLPRHVPLLCAAGHWPKNAISGCIATTNLTATVQTVSDWLRP